MKPPDNTRLYESDLATFWFDENYILCAIAKKTHRTVDKQKKTYELIRQISDNKKVCILSDATSVSPLDKETREYVALEIPTIFKAMAIISASALGRTIANIFLTLKRQPVPIKMFANEKDAKEWLKQYL